MYAICKQMNRNHLKMANVIGRLSCWLVFLICLTKCGKPHENRSKLNASEPPTIDTVLIDSTAKQIVETVLNLPSVIKFSKADFIQKKYGPISIYFSQDSVAKSISSIYQNGYSLKLVQSVDTIDTAEEPCYVFSKITIDNNEAYVYMTFDITGALAYGKMKYIEGKWLPDKEFLVGVR